MSTLVNGINPFHTEEEELFFYDCWDECRGVIESVCRSGAFITLDNGEKAFSYDCASVPVGTEIMCTVLKKAREEEGKRMLVGFDSRLDDYGLAG